MLNKHRIELFYNPEISLLCINTQDTKYIYSKVILTTVFIIALSTIGKSCNQPRTPTIDVDHEDMVQIENGMLHDCKEFVQFTST